MIFPIGDDQVRGGHFPYASYAFIAFNVLAFFYQMSFPDALICGYGSIPNNILAGKDYFTLFTSMFMHGGWMHLIGNMMFLWVFADNIEAKIGTVGFIIFYLLGGLAAHGLHIFMSMGGDLASCCSLCVDGAYVACPEGVNPCEGSVPTVGASGAIAAVLGAYLVMFPQSKVKILVIYFFKSFHIAAIYFLGFWIAQQLFSGFMSMGGQAGGGVAWFAHIGGFIFGIVAGYFARMSYGGGLGAPTQGKPIDSPRTKDGGDGFV